ncbi:hypothetical protein H7F15_17380 [Pontibacter sp. Tf4]|uniref:hypothetical protein n=1 Tax=Pontibacter sp. Tf4 TaxID=2761620 RepID=UPI00162A488C|nr:hypothetical protein [Pontibacter sp. Tf4]MBB6612817.1 hypothetical protein [Pontibacter sp. Tf4]
MKILRHLLLFTFICLLGASCNPMNGRKAIVVDDDGRSMRFERNRQESRNDKWDARKKKNFKQNKYKRRD